MDNYKFKLGLAIAREEELKKKLDALTTYDEAKERELFEKTRNAHTIRRNAVGDYVLPSSQDAWSGWSECAKSRARSAE